MIWQKHEVESYSKIKAKSDQEGKELATYIKDLLRRHLSKDE